MAWTSSAGIAALALAAATLASPAAAQETPGVTKDKVTIGAWVTQTGPVAIYGIPVKAGAQAYF